MMNKHLLSFLMLSSLCATASAQNSVSVDLTDKLLVNPDFELFECKVKPANQSKAAEIEALPEFGQVLRFKDEYKSGDATAIYREAARGVPYGWSMNQPETGEEGGFGGNSYGVNSDAYNPHGNAACWFSQGTFPVGWKLYQTIPASKLEPGLYKVTCLLWQEVSLNKASNTNTTYQEGYTYTNIAGTCCLFANNSVQYYGRKDDYNEAGLTPTDEVVTYANHMFGLNKNGVKLHPMVVYVNVKEGEDLTIGIRTSHIDKYGKPRGNRSGWFKADNFRVEKVLSQPEKDADEFTAEVLTNSSFELDHNGEVTDKQICNGDSHASQTPGSDGYNPDFTYYGWENDNLPDDYGQHPNFCWGLMGHNAGYMDGKNTPMENTRLYQYIDADKLEPGVYTLSCMAWQPTDLKGFGQFRIYADNGNNTYVTYYGVESKYEKNQTEGEIATFAGLPGGVDSYSKRSRILEDMYVNIPVYPDQDLEVGLKTGGQNGDADEAVVHAGAFHIDYFRINKTSNLPVNYTAETNDVQAENYKVRATLDCAVANNIWNTVCLPFALNAADIQTIFGKDAKVAAFDGADATTANFKTVAEMEAGVPYLVYATDALPAPMVIDDVVITKSSAETVTKGNFSFVGGFSATTINAGDQNSLVVNGDGTLKPAAEATTVSAFHAYMKSATGGAATYTVNGTIVTGIDSITTGVESKDAKVFNLAGQRVNNDAKGVVIANGKTIIKK